MVTIKELAERYDMTPAKARRILRNNKIKKRKYHWKWRPGTKGLQEVEDILKQYQDYIK